MADLCNHELLSGARCVLPAGHRSKMHQPPDVDDAATAIARTRRPTRDIDEPTLFVGHDHPHTSHEMQAKALGRSGTLRREIVGLIRDAEDDGRGGLTDWEGEIVTGRSHQSYSGARATLKKEGWLEPSGITRPDVRTNRPDPNEWIAWRLTRGGRARLAAENI